MDCRKAVVRLGLAAGLLLPAIPGPAPAYIDIPPATLGRMCGATMAITLMRVERLDREGGRVLYRAVRDLKGNSPSDVLRHAVGTKPSGGREVVRWAAVGKQAVHFASASRNYSYTYLDGHWYSSSLAGGWWRLVRGEPQMLRCFCGTAGELVAAVEAVVAGKEVVVPCLAGERAEDLRPDRGRVRRLRAGLKRLDYNPKRDFVGWGSAEGTVVASEKGRVVVRVGDKDRSIPLKGVATLDQKGRALEGRAAAAALRPGARVEITERGGKVTEVRAGP